MATLTRSRRPDRARLRPTSTASPPEDADAVRVTRYQRFVRRQWPVLLAAVVLGGALGMVRSATAHHTYTSTVSVVAPPVAVEAGLPPLHDGPYALVDQKPVLDTMDTEAQLATSGSVIEQLKRVPGFHVPADQLAGRVTVTVPPNSRVLTIGVRASRPGNARQGARTIARTYIKLRSRVIGEYQTRNRQAINRRLVILQAEIDALPPDPDAVARLRVRTRHQALLRQMLDARKQLDYTDQFAQVVRAPDRPTHPDDPGSAVNRTSGAGVGLLGGLVVGLVRDRRPRRLRYARDVRRRIRVPVLTEVRRDDLADAGRRLRNLGFAEDARTILVTGMPGESADPVAVSVAAAFAHGGAPTTLLCVGDDHVPGHRARPGGDAERDPDVAPFRVETVAAHEGDRGLADAVAEARQGSGVVVISGPALATAEATTLAAIADLTFVTVALKQVTDRPLTTAIAHLESAGAPPRGIVITHGKGAP
jgi:capsular polysaccharide biosynthesis protein